MKIITIDVGTSSMKSTLYDAHGNLLKVFAHEYYSEYPQEGYVEQNPLTWMIALEDVLTKMGHYCFDNNIELSAISVTSQRSSMIPVDKTGTPLMNAIMWQDKRTADICEDLIETYGLDYFYKKTGLRINPYFVLPKILWLRDNALDIYQDAYKFIGVQDYVVHQLTGEFVTDHSQACRTCLMDIKDFNWDENLLDLAGIDASRLPRLVKPGSIGGYLEERLAKITKLDSSIPVILAGGDQQNAALALGVFKQGTAEANTGTGSFVLSAVDKPYFDEEARVLCQAAAVPGKWIMEAGIFNTGAIYRWFRDNFYQDIEFESEAYTIMNQEAEGSPPGASGITLIPHFQGSAAPYWNPFAKGVFFNLSMGNQRGDLTRAIMEGISAELATNIRLIEKLVDGLDYVSVAGGLTRSDLFCDIQANLFDKKVIRNKNSEATSLGASMLSMVTLGKYEKIEEAYSNMTQDEPDEFLPNPELKEVYEKVYERKMVLYDAINFGDVYKAYL